MINFSSGLKALFGRGFSFWDNEMDDNLRKISDHMGNIKAAGPPGTAIIGTPTLGVAYLEIDGSYTVYDLNSAAVTTAATYQARQGLIAGDGQKIYSNTGESWLPIADVTNNASADATAALAAANAALVRLDDIVNDNIISPNEKPDLILRVAVINGEQTGIDNSATALSITTLKTAYDNAIAVLNAYLATLTTPVLWNDIIGNTAVDRATFHQKFLDVFNAKQALLNKIAEEAALRADTTYLTGTITTPQIAPNAATEVITATVASINYPETPHASSSVIYLPIITYSIPAKTVSYTLRTTFTFSYICTTLHGDGDGNIVTPVIARSVSGFDNGTPIKLKSSASPEPNSGQYSATVIQTSLIAANETVDVSLYPELSLSGPVLSVWINSDFTFTGVTAVMELIKR